MKDLEHIKALTRIKENYERLWQENLTKEEDIKEEYDAVCAGIKALEQTSSLDKARAEIEQLETYDRYTGESYLACEFREDVLYIIDKYKAEIEDKG